MLLPLSHSCATAYLLYHFFFTLSTPFQKFFSGFFQAVLLSSVAVTTFVLYHFLFFLSRTFSHFLSKIFAIYLLPSHLIPCSTVMLLYTFSIQLSSKKNDYIPTAFYSIYPTQNARIKIILALHKYYIYQLMLLFSH